MKTQQGYVEPTRQQKKAAVSPPTLGAAKQGAVTPVRRMRRRAATGATIRSPGRETASQPAEADIRESRRNKREQLRTSQP
jgi:hypothetical protein